MRAADERARLRGKNDVGCAGPSKSENRRGGGALEVGAASSVMLRRRPLWYVDGGVVPAVSTGESSGELAGIDAREDDGVSAVGVTSCAEVAARSATGDDGCVSVAGEASGSAIEVRFQNGLDETSTDREVAIDGASDGASDERRMWWSDLARAIGRGSGEDPLCGSASDSTERFAIPRRWPRPNQFAKREWRGSPETDATSDQGRSVLGSVIFFEGWSSTGRASKYEWWRGRCEVSGVGSVIVGWRLCTTPGVGGAVAVALVRP